MHLNKNFYRSMNFWGGISAEVLGFWGFSPLTTTSILDLVFSLALIVLGIYELFCGLIVVRMGQDDSK